MLTPNDVDGNFAALIAWLETRDSSETYDFWNTKDCLLARFGKAMGYAVRGAGGDYFRISDDGSETVEAYFVQPEGSHVSSGEPSTMGAALQRALAWRAEHAA